MIVRLGQTSDHLITTKIALLLVMSLLPVLKKTISVGGVVPTIVLLDYTFAHHGVAEVLVV
nr:hypothetical protein [Pleurocapsa sp. CCALA 161]